MSWREATTKGSSAFGMNSKLERMQEQVIILLRDRDREQPLERQRKKSLSQWSDTDRPADFLKKFEQTLICNEEQKHR